MSDPEEGWLTLKELKFKRRILECTQRQFNDSMESKFKLIDDCIKAKKEKLMEELEEKEKHGEL